jgi:hypothetical protein
MRQYIQDRKLHSILTAIETHLGYTISAVILPKNMHKTHGAAVGIENGKWQFQYNPGDYPSHATLCHEMMHVILSIEGWHVWQIFPFVPDGYFEILSYDFALTLPQHFCINRRVEVLGYMEREEFEKDMCNFAHAIQEKQPVPPAHQVHFYRIQVLSIAHLFLAPSAHRAKVSFRNALQQHRPRMLSLVDSICEVVLKWQPLDSQSSEYLVYDILEALGMRKEILRPSQLDNIYFPDFFASRIKPLADQAPQ